MDYINQLMNLGLKDKEAAVYLACLELGPSPVQPIAKKAGVVRATTYVIIESLMTMGLITKYKEGKKTVFSAETPRQLLRLLERQEEIIQEKQHDIESILPELQMLTKAGTDKPSVRYFQGKEGLRAIRQEIIMYTSSEDMLYNFTPMDHLRAIFSRDEDTYYSQRIAKGIRAKTLLTAKSHEVKQEWFSVPSHGGKTEVRFVPPEKFPVPAGMTIYKDRIAIGSYTGKLFGVIIESEQMASMMRAIFDLAWESASPVDIQNK